MAFILKGYPRLSETFIAQEIRALEQRQFEIEIWSLRHPTDSRTHEVHDQIRAPVAYLPEYLHEEPLRVLRAWLAGRKRPGYGRAWQKFVADLRRDRSRNRVRRFGQALVLAHELSNDVERLHAHFLHTPASVTRYASLLTGVRWSASAHAKDIWTSPRWELAEKLDECDWTVTCTQTNCTYLRSLCAEPDKVQLVYHGLDLDRFPVVDAAEDKHVETRPMRILSVGRAVEKKGYDILLDALHQLSAEVDWQLVHIGGGPLLGALEQKARSLGIAQRITWLGARDQRDVLAAYRQADVFVLASRITDDGDRDGLPNVLMEAQSQGVACVSTSVSAIPELIEDEVSGLLVAPDDVGALADALRRVLEDRELRERLGREGCARVRSRFSLQESIEPLVARLQCGSVQTGLEPR